MPGPSERERFLRRFHAAMPGSTSRALARGASYERLAALVEPAARTLDLGCGDGHLARVLASRGCRTVGVDLSLAELGLAGGNVACARAQALPFADRSFDAAVSHFAFMLFEDADQVVAELARVLVPGGRFAAILGGGPTADGDDAFHRFLALARHQVRAPIRFGDPRAKSEAGWRSVFAEWRDVTFERDLIDLSGSFDEVWQFLGASYELADVDREALREELRVATVEQSRVMCQAVIWIATATRSGETCAAHRR